MTQERVLNPQDAVATTRTLRAVSVSIGSSKRDGSFETELLGRRVSLERIGTDGDLERAEAIIRDLDGEVDAIGLGGLDLFVQAAGRRYYLRDGVRLAREARTTPVVCGAGLKDTLERLAVQKLDECIGWRGKRVLMVSAVDRFGMAEELVEQGAETIFGDVVFALNVALPLRSLAQLKRVARAALPVVRQLPISWLYPVGEKQESAGKGRGTRYFQWAEVIAGDFHFIRRHAPERLDGKVILTNTTTAADVAELKERGVASLYTTTPRFDGRSLPTNLLDAALVAASGRHPLSAQEYRELIGRAGLEPQAVF